MIKKVILPLLLLLFCASAVYAYGTEYAEGEIIVIIDDSYTYQAMGKYSLNKYSEAINSMAESFAESTGLESLGTFPEISSISGNHIVHLRSKTKSTEQLMQELENNPYVKSVQPNYIRFPFYISNEQFFGDSVSGNSESDFTPNDYYYDEQWGMQNIGMPQVWEYATGGENACVAVIDTGIDYNHPDLNAKMAKDSYGNYGRLFKNRAQSGNPMDTQGHGTHVAGIIGAVGNNEIGVAGINWKVKMLAVNVMSDGSAFDSDVVTAINYILSEKNKGLNIRIANMSFGGWDTPISDNSPFKTAIGSLNDAGILCIMAVGNESQNIGDPNGKYVGKLVYPACFRFSNTITVGSIGREDVISSYTNFGSEWVDIAAPGDDIISTLHNNKYIVMGGTSMSAAHVTGAAAILCAAFPNETASQIKGRILKGARNSGNSKAYFANGFLDVAGAYGIEPEAVKDEPMTSIKITGERNITLGDSILLSHTKNPTNASGYFEYSWKSSNESTVNLVDSNNASVEATGISNGEATMTISVTQTLQDGTKITKSDSIVVTVSSSSSSSSSGGCNLGLFLICLLPKLLFFKIKN